MVEARQIEAFVNRIAPFDLACDWDNVGLCIGKKDQAVSKVLLSLDLTFDVIDEAAELGAEMIVTHHPLFLEVNRKILLDNDTQKKAFEMLSRGICFLAAHTNFDGAESGVNQVLAEKLGLQEIERLADTRQLCGLDTRCGRVRPVRFGEFIEAVKRALGIPHVKYVGNPEDVVSTVAVMGGSGGDFVEYLVEEDIDLLVTSDVKYHEAQYAFEHGKKLIDAGHFETEYPAVLHLKALLEKEFGDAAEFVLSGRHARTFWNYD